MTNEEKMAIKWCYNVAMCFADDVLGDIILENEDGQFSLKETITGLLGESDE